LQCGSRPEQQNLEHRGLEPQTVLQLGVREPMDLPEDQRISLLWAQSLERGANLARCRSGARCRRLQRIRVERDQSPSAPPLVKMPPGKILCDPKKPGSWHSRLRTPQESLVRIQKRALGNVLRLSAIAYEVERQSANRADVLAVEVLEREIQLAPSGRNGHRPVLYDLPDPQTNHLYR